MNETLIHTGRFNPGATVPRVVTAASLRQRSDEAAMMINKLTANYFSGRRGDEIFTLIKSECEIVAVWQQIFSLRERV